MTHANLQRVVFLGRKPHAASALKYLGEQGVSVACVVTPDTPESNPALHAVARKSNIPLITDDAVLYEAIKEDDPSLKNIDLVISYLYPQRILMPLIRLPRLGCVNFHPAPLPDYKSRAGYNTAILDQRDEYGVSAHFIDSEVFDAGPIIDVLRFAIDPHHETALSLESTAQEKLLEIFRVTMDRFIRGEKIELQPNEGGVYLTAKQLEALKEINLAKDTLEAIERKIRAFFFPPYTGAHITVGGEKFTLVNQKFLDMIAEALQANRKK